MLIRSCFQLSFYMQGIWHSPNIRHSCTSCLLHAGNMAFSKHQAFMYILSFTCREYGILQTSGMHLHPVFYMQGVWHSPNIRHACTSCLLHAGSMAFSKHQTCMYILSFTCREYGILQTSDMHVHPVFYMQGEWHSPNIRHACTSCLLHAGGMAFSKHQACMYILSLGLLSLIRPICYGS